MAKLITQKQAEKDLQNQIDVAKKWHAAGWDLENIADGLWNKLAANVEIKNGELLIWARLPEDSRFEIKAIIK